MLICGLKGNLRLSSGQSHHTPACQAIISDHSLIICRAEGAMLGPVLSADCTSLFSPGAVIKMWLGDLSKTRNLLDQRPYLLGSEVYCHICMKATLPLWPRSQLSLSYLSMTGMLRHGDMGTKWWLTLTQGHPGNDLVEHFCTVA